MLVNIKNLLDLKVTAANKKIGRVYDFYFNDMDWNISYTEIKPRLLALKNLVANNMKLGQPKLDHKLLPIMINQDTAYDLPESETVQTVSDAKEAKQSAFRTWPLNLTNLNTLDFTEAERLADLMVRDKEDSLSNSHLRSFREVCGYRINTPGGSFGRLQSLILETDIWKIKYLLVEKRKLFKSNKRILISPANVRDIKWEDNSIYIDLSKKIIKESPDYENVKSISDSFEKKLIRHYIKRNRQRQNQKINQ